MLLVGDLATAPHHDDPVGDREDVGHAVADENDRDAAVAQLADQVQHLRHLAHRDGRRRLVHQHDLGLREHGARDRDRLPLAARHLLDEVARARLRLQFLEDLAGAPVHGGIVEDAERSDAAAQLAAEEDIGRRGQIVAERQILVNDLDAVPARFDRPVQHDLLAVHAHRAVARQKVAGDHLDQRRLAGAVVAHEADHLACLQRQRDVVDGLDGAEMFRNVGEFENRHQSLPPCPVRPHRSAVQTRTRTLSRSRLRLLLPGRTPNTDLCRRPRGRQSNGQTNQICNATRAFPDDDRCRLRPKIGFVRQNRLTAASAPLLASEWESISKAYRPGIGLQAAVETIRTLPTSRSIWCGGHVYPPCFKGGMNEEN